MNKQELIRQTTEALFVQGNFDFAEIAFSAHYIAHAGNKTWSGHKFIKQYAKKLRRAIADINIQKNRVFKKNIVKKPEICRKFFKE